MKKFIALLMALVMTMSLATVAWGAVPTVTDGLATLSANFEMDALWTVNADTTLDLAGNELTRANGNTVIYVTDGAKLTIKDSVGGGKIVATGTQVPVQVINGTLVLESGSIEAVETGVFVKNGSFTMENGSVSATTGTGVYVSTDATFSMLDGSVEAGKIGVYVKEGSFTMEDGSVSATAGDGVFVSTGAIFSMLDGSVTGTNAGIIGNGTAGEGNTTITISGGSVSSSEIGIYHPQDGTLTINGGTITGKTGVYVKSGDVTISGDAVINGTGAAANYVYDGTNAYPTGDALVIDSCGYPGGAPDVSVTGGSFSSTNAAAVASYVGNGVTDVVDEFVTGGTFTTLPDESLLADGVEFIGNTVGVPEKKSTSYEGLYARTADMASTDPTIPGIEIVVTPAKAPKYNKTTGFVEQPGEVEHVNITGWGGDYVFVNSTDDADVVLYKDEAGKQIRFRLAAVNTPEYAEGVKFTNFGDKCGQVDYDDYDKDEVYFTAKGDVNEGIYVADEDGFLNVMYGNKLVAVMPIGLTYTDDAVPHTPIYTTKNGVVESIECGACGLDAVKVPNVLSLPKGADVVDGESVWYWPTATTTPSTDKTVTSAETFDAGIAMYVGMSVMAAAGSAVVIGKKKD